MGKKLSVEETIEIDRVVPEMDECRLIIMKMIEQAVRDYLRLQGAVSVKDQLDYDTAVDFLFEDDYRVPWGDVELSLNDFLNILGLDTSWFRARVLLAQERKARKFLLHDEVDASEPVTEDDEGVLDT